MQCSDVEHILTLNSEERQEALLSLPESQWFERKSGRIAPKDLATALVAFANAEGGTLAIGLHNGKVDGVTTQAANSLRQAAHDFTSPPVALRAHECSLPGGKTALILDVPPSTMVHETKKGDCFLRIGDESIRLNFHQRRELEFDRTPTPFDGTPGHFTIGDLSTQALDAYQNLLGTSSHTSTLNARNLLTREGEVNVAGYLLFCDTPQHAFPNAYVRVLQYTADERGTGSQQNLAAEGDIRCEGSIPQQIEKAIDAIRDRLPARRALGSSGKFENTPIVPVGAWLEGLVNAVVHRSYSIAGDHVRVEIFPHRIEITSPGRFPGLVDPANPLHIGRLARNPRIARVCADLGITQELGEGIRRIFSEMQSEGLADPTYEQGAGHVRLTLSASDSLPTREAEALGPGALAVLTILRQAETPLSTGEITSSLNITRPTALRHLKALREAGIIAWAGKSSHDPRASWYLP